MLIEIDYGTFALELNDFDFESLIKHVLGAERVPDTVSVSLSFVSQDEIAQLNEKYRGKNGPTDVLSFECDSLDDAQEVSSGEAEPLVLGDVIIAGEVARSQAQEYGLSFQEELSFLIIHGLLHLCGYDHIEDEDANVMEQREQALFGKWFNTEKELRPQNVHE